MKKSFTLAMVIVAITGASAAVFFKPNESFASSEGSGLKGPSTHIAFGIRNKKAPDLDEYYTFLGSLKISLFNYWFTENSYISFLAPGVGFQRSLHFIVSLSPIIVNHASGFGFSFDFFPVSDRSDRPGGPFGLSLNIDVIQLANFFTR